jgi:CubicO group peptidase (beta-lactamase class C family)
VDVPVSGLCDPGFEQVRREFIDNFATRGEIGAGVCVLVDGRIVVDLVGGWTDDTHREPWSPDSLVNFYSVGKALVALVALQLLAEHAVDLDRPVAMLWPEFAAAGKGEATIRQALCHRAGVPALRPSLTNEDLWSWSRMADALAATKPWWPPGTRHAYHTNTYGHLIGELVRRLSGESCSARLRALAAPLQADVWFGMPAEEQRRCVDIQWAGSDNTAVEWDGLSGDDYMVMRSYFNPPGYSSVGVVNTPAWRSAEVPSTNGHGTARGVASIYAALLEPDRLLPAGLLAEAVSPQSMGYCPVLGEEVTFGLGFTPTTPRRPFGPNPGSFGHFGTGGAVGFADPQSGVAFGYVMNQVIPRWQSTRNRALIAAVFASL